MRILKLNEELVELNRNLEGRIDQRTSQLTVQNQRLTEYTFINAHKLRAPVASILGLINLMQQVKPEEKDAILAHLKTCGEQLDTIIHEVSRNLEAAIVHEK
jgi:signal transduction histidine kinase